MKPAATIAPFRLQREVGSTEELGKQRIRLSGLAGLCGGPS